MRVGQYIRAIRKQKKIGQGKLARVLGRNQQDVYAWEVGKCRVPADELPEIATALNISILDLFDEARTQNVAGVARESESENGPS